MFKRYRETQTAEIGIILIAFFVFGVCVALMPFGKVWASQDVGKYKQTMLEMQRDASRKMKSFKQGNLGLKTKQHITKWQSTIDDLENGISNSKDKYKSDVEKLKQDIDRHQEKHKEDLKKLKKQSVRLLQTPKVRRHLKDMGVDFESTAAKDIFVFVSSSLTKKNLIDLLTQAKKVGATPVMRGFVDNSFKKTALFLQSAVEKTGAGVVIDPDLFKTYQITQVPSFVIAKGGVYDKLSGNVPLDYVMREMKEKGDVFKGKLKK